MIESIPNVSEGQRPEVLAALTAVLRGVPGLRLLDISADSAHHRSVFTYAGDAAALETAAMALIATAIAHIDLRTHRGVHPRMGAVDVLPFVPLEGATLDHTDSAGLVIRNPNKPPLVAIEGLVNDDELSASIEAIIGTDEVHIVHGGAEVIDSRYRDFKFAAGDVITVNAWR